MWVETKRGGGGSTEIKTERTSERQKELNIRRVRPAVKIIVQSRFERFVFNVC